VFFVVMSNWVCPSYSKASYVFLTFSVLEGVCECWKPCNVCRVQQLEDTRRECYYDSVCESEGRLSHVNQVLLSPKWSLCSQGERITPNESTRDKQDRVKLSCCNICEDVCCRYK